MDTVIVEKFEHMATIYMNNQNKKNALDETLSKELLLNIKELSIDDTINVVVLTSKGDVFCAGGDIKEFIHGTALSAIEHYEKMSVNVDILRIVDILKKPLVAAITGYALGGGFGLAANAHIVVSHPQTKYGMPEINLGILPYVIYPYVKRAIGERYATMLALTGKIIDADEAYRIGLVHFIEENPLQKAQQIALKIASKSPLVLKLAIECMNASRNTNLEGDYLSLLRIINFSAEDLSIGINAFLNKTKPLWKGK